MEIQKVIVNGKVTELNHQVCTRCIQDSSIPGIEFDDKGECNFCKLYDKMCVIFPNGEQGEHIWNQHLDEIKKFGFGKKYDCLVGISGGRDSIYTLWNAVKMWKLRPIAVHFNDGFDNPVAGENMVKACKKLGIELRTITSDWREAKELKIDFLKASTPDLNLGTDIGIATALYGVAHKEGLKHIIIGQSFRTEGTKPLSWSFFEGRYLKTVHKKFGKTPLRKWTPNDPGFNLGIKEMFYYTIIKGIKTFTPMYYHDYIRKDAEKIIVEELDWVYPGAHYFDDLYHALIKYVHRAKFNIDMNMNSDAALVRSGQLDREEGLKRAHGVYKIEDPKIIDLCIKRLSITRTEFDTWMTYEPKTFHDYPTNWWIIKLAKYPIKLLSSLNLLPKVAYLKYFECGK